MSCFIIIFSTIPYHIFIIDFAHIQIIIRTAKGMVKNVWFKMNTFQKKQRNVRCQIFEMSDFCMAYPEMNGGVLRYYIYNITILYIINIIYNIFYLSFHYWGVAHRKSDIFLIWQSYTLRRVSANNLLPYPWKFFLGYSQNFAHVCPHSSLQGKGCI